MDSAKSHFVRFYLFFDTSNLAKEDMKLLVLLMTLWLQCPIKNPVTGDYVSLEEVIKMRSEDTLSMMNNIGYKGTMFNPGSHSHLIMFFVEAKAEKYMEAIALLKQSLFNVEFTEERAKTVMIQLLNSIPSEKLSAAKIVNSLSDNLYFNNKSAIYHASFLRQQKYLAAALENLRVNPGN